MLHYVMLFVFLEHVFDATGRFVRDRPPEIRIGDSLVMISNEEPRARAPAFIYVYVEDADVTYDRAMEAGAISIEPPWDTPYGDRRGTVRDEWGNVWQIATYQGSS